jgi:hypothetical protein
MVLVVPGDKVHATVQVLGNAGQKGVYAIGKCKPMLTTSPNMYIYTAQWLSVTDRLQRRVTHRGFGVSSGKVTRSHVTVSRYLHVYLIDNKR